MTRKRSRVVREGAERKGPKGTSLAAFVGFTELTRAGTMVSNQIFKPLLVFGVVGVMYFAICWPLSFLGSRLEKKLAVALR